MNEENQVANKERNFMRDVFINTMKNSNYEHILKELKRLKKGKASIAIEQGAQSPTFENIVKSSRDYGIITDYECSINEDSSTVKLKIELNGLDTCNCIFPIDSVIQVPTAGIYASWHSVEYLKFFLVIHPQYERASSNRIIDYDILAKDRIDSILSEFVKNNGQVMIDVTKYRRHYYKMGYQYHGYEMMGQYDPWYDCYHVVCTIENYNISYNPMVSSYATISLNIIEYANAYHDKIERNSTKLQIRVPLYDVNITKNVGMQPQYELNWNITDEEVKITFSY